MLGKSLNKLYTGADTISGRSQLDLSNISETHNWLKNKHYSTIVHSAAFTDLNYCKNNIDKAIILHASIVDVLSEHCDRLVYISTVPIWEKNEYTPNEYFETKKLGEHVTLKRADNIVVGDYDREDISVSAFTSYPESFTDADVMAKMWYLRGVIAD